MHFSPCQTRRRHEDDGTRYTARVMHPDEATRKQHEELGFHEGWNTCFTQLEEFAAQLK
ncbi:SRPBCC domain-containing protein [Cupriavidus oxalaticus]|uniref:SRPBCC domain-containing protein n=1 Tax=Cupriavidus TaxID=106589 RepID=UPI003D65145D